MKLMMELNTLPDVEFSQEQSTILRAIAKVLKLSVAHLNVYFEQEQAHDFMQSTSTFPNPHNPHWVTMLSY
jgi:uncharacterized protein (DUF2384 family)